MGWLPGVPLEGVLFSGCIAGIMFPIALLLVVLGLINQRRAQASQAWPAVAGQITGSRLGTQSSDDGTSYFPMVHYQYAVAGQAYQNDRIVFGGGITGNRGPAETILARYPVGHTVPVYYNPANPQEAVLERRSGSTTLLVGIGAFLMVLGCGIFACLSVLYVARLNV